MKFKFESIRYCFGDERKDMKETFKGYDASVKFVNSFNEKSFSSN